MVLPSVPSVRRAAAPLYWSARTARAWPCGWRGRRRRAIIRDGACFSGCPRSIYLGSPFGALSAGAAAGGALVGYLQHRWHERVT
jgi:hypothetical protein